MRHEPAIVPEFLGAKNRTAADCLRCRSGALTPARIPISKAKVCCSGSSWIAIDSLKDTISFERQVLDQHTRCTARREHDSPCADRLLGFEPVSESVCIPVGKRIERTGIGKAHP